MSKPWNFVKAFAGKTFEQSAKETNDTVPKKTFIELAKEAILEESKKDPTERWNKMVDSGLIDREGNVTLNEAWKSATKIMGAESEKILDEAAKRLDAYVTLPSEKPVVEIVVPVAKPSKQKRKKRKK